MSMRWFLARHQVRCCRCSNRRLLTNTVFYLGFLLLFYVLIGEYSREFLLMIAGIFVTGGLPEALVAALTVPPILKALSRINYFS